MMGASRLRDFATTALTLGLMACSAAGTGICATASRPEEVCISEGTFTMGHTALPPPAPRPDTAFNPGPLNDWTPQRSVRLSAFHIDRYEVTWGRYAACVDAGVCTVRGISTFPSTLAALSDAAMADLPAYNVLFDEAQAFCAWDGKRLPTEAEWERAARGLDARDFPWGNQTAQPELLSALITYAPESMTQNVPAAVGTHPQDVSPDGVYDLFANVEEWVGDWYDPKAYESGSDVNPTGPGGPATGDRVLRGNRWNVAGGRSWDVEGRGAPVWFRDRRAPGATGTGFRCARDDT